MKEEFLKRRLELSEDLSHAIHMMDVEELNYKEQIPLIKEEVDRIDRILEII